MRYAQQAYGLKAYPLVQEAVKKPRHWRTVLRIDPNVAKPTLEYIRNNYLMIAKGCTMGQLRELNDAFEAAKREIV